MAQLTLVTCQCEHASHFWGDDEPRTLSPNGNPSHIYGTKYAVGFMMAGPAGLTICRDCREDCHGN
jgi:hypothetical protein